MHTLTVFTPTYNRIETLKQTYRSLCRQTSKDFEWLIVDDGSTDNTSSFVRQWIQDGKVPITYVYQENQGMHGAHNTAYRNIHTELNVCIDSDDFMPDDAVENIVSFWQENGSERYAGLVGLDADSKGHLIGNAFTEETTTLDYFYTHGGRGDKKLVYRTSVIKAYPEYPRFPGEKYFSLGYKYQLIDQDYPLLTLNKVLVHVEYRADGSSLNMFRQYVKNPKGFVFLRKSAMRLASTRKRRFVEAVHYVADSLLAGDGLFLLHSPKKGLTLMAVPLGLMWYVYIKYRTRKR